MSIQITALLEPIRESDLISFEVQIGAMLPSDYREFLLTHNGGKPSLQTYTISSSEGEDHLPYFLGFSDKYYYSLNWYFQTYIGRIPSNLLPIAPDDFSNLVCLSVAGEDVGKVYFWDHDEEVMSGEADYSNVYLLAASFTEFINSLHHSNTTDAC